MTFLALHVIPLHHTVVARHGVPWQSWWGCSGPLERCPLFAAHRRVCFAEFILSQRFFAAPRASAHQNDTRRRARNDNPLPPKFDIRLPNLVNLSSFLDMEGTYAIVETGGKQYKVTAGQKVDVDRLAVAEGENVELSRVLLIVDDKDTIIGSPTIDGAKVMATCLGERKGDKIIVFKYKPKVRYRRKTGHRQLYTRLEIKEIVKPGEAVAKRTRKKKVTAGGKG